MRANPIRFLMLAGVVAFAPTRAAAQTPADSAQAQPPTVTLTQAIDLAIKSQPAIIQAEGNVDVAHASQRQAFGNYLPSLSANSSWGLNPKRQIFNQTTQTYLTPSRTSLSGGFNANLTLFDGFQREAQNRAASAGAANADASLVNQKFQVILQTKQAFFNALAAEELVRAADAQIQQAQDQHKIAKDKLTAGTATRADTLQTTVQLANARLARLTAVTQEETARAQLARLIGVNYSVRPVADSSLYALPQIDTLELRQETIANSPAVGQAEASARTARANLAVSRAQYFPSLNASYSRSVTGTDLSSLSGTWQLRLGLSWSIFNGFTRETNMARSAAARDVADATVADTKRQVSTQLTQQLAALASAEQRIDIARASGAAANENLRVQQERYRVGAATIVDVQTAETAVAQAASDLVRARLDFLVAKAQIEALIGRNL